VLPDGSRVINGQKEPEALKTASFLIVRDGIADSAVASSADRVRKVIRLEGRGSVDEAAFAGRGATIHHVGSPALISVAEHTVMVILMLLKRFQEASERLRAGVVAGDVEPAETTQDSYAYNWVDLEHFEALLRKRVGLVGLGKIGRATAVRLRCLGADVVYTKRTRLDEADEQALGVSWANFDDLLAMSDCVSLHARVYPETERMMGAREFGLMKRGSFFVNTARGRLVDEEAMLRALESGHLAGAALDVFWYEPLPKDSPLLKVKNLLLTPHTGGIPLAESQAIELVDAARVISRDAE